MKTISILIVWLVLFATGNSEEIKIPNDRLEVHVYGDSKVPYHVAGVKLKDAKAAASLLKYIYSNWNKGKRPVLVAESHSKRVLSGEDVFWKAVKEVSTKWKVRVIHMPVPMGFAPESSQEVSRLSKAWKKSSGKKMTEQGAASDR